MRSVGPEAIVSLTAFAIKRGQGSKKNGGSWGNVVPVEIGEPAGCLALHIAGASLVEFVEGNILEQVFDTLFCGTLRLGFRKFRKSLPLVSSENINAACKTGE